MVILMFVGRMVNLIEIDTIRISWSACRSWHRIQTSRCGTMSVFFLLLSSDTVIKMSNACQINEKKLFVEILSVNWFILQNYIRQTRKWMLWQGDWEAKKSRKCNENQAKKKDRADYKRLLKSKHILLGTLGLDAVELEIWLDLNCMNFEQEKRKWRGKQSKQANKTWNNTQLS